jgi:hypothetical protein
MCGMDGMGHRPIPNARLRVIPEARYDAEHAGEVAHQRRQAPAGSPLPAERGQAVWGS